MVKLLTLERWEWERWPTSFAILAINYKEQVLSFVLKLENGMGPLISLVYWMLRVSIKPLSHNFICLLLLNHILVGLSYLFCSSVQPKYIHCNRGSR